jgi:biotin carboxyl carrier protein
VSTNVIENPAQELAAEDEKKPHRIAKPTNLPREAFGWRLLRLGIAIPLGLLSMVALFPFSVVPVSTQAVVNARLSRVRSPMEGQLGPVHLETGDVVSAGQVLTTVSTPTSLLRTEALGDLRTLDDVQQEDSRVTAELSAAQTSKARYDQMYNDHLAHVAQDLQGQIKDMQPDVTDAQQRVTATSAEVKRDQQAMAEHLIPRTMLDQAVAKGDLAQQKLNDVKARQDRLQQQVSEAKSGYLLDPASAPSFMAARNQAATDVDRLAAQKASLDARIKGDVGQSGRDITSPRSGAIPSVVVSPVSGTIWSRSVATGQSVQEGDDLFRIADAESIHVEVWLDRRYGPQLSIGDIALVYMGGLGKEVQGRVTSFEGTSRRVDEQEIDAIDLQAVHPDQYHVSIELQPGDRKAVYIGQAAKVLFPGARHPYRSKVYFWLTRL